MGCRTSTDHSSASMMRIREQGRAGGLWSARRLLHNKMGERVRRVPRAPPATSNAARLAMRGNTRTDTKPEMAVRKLLYRLGYRYRLHAIELPGTPDVVFHRWKVALFVHGCFWHQHPSSRCRLRSMPRSNIEYWSAKLARNVERDAEHRAELKALGWRMLTVWECETLDPYGLERKLRSFLP